MTTLQGMLAQTIHEDRVRGYEDRARRHRFEAPETTPIAQQLRSVFDRMLGSTARQANAPTAARS
jgi:hypothetical protein